MNAEADDTTRVLVDDQHDPIRSQGNGFASKQVHAPKAVLSVAQERQPRRALSVRVRSIRTRQNSADDVLIDVYAKCTRDDHRNTRGAKAGIAFLQRQDSRSKLSGRPLRSRLCPRLRCEQPAVLAAHECTMELQQCRRPYGDGDPRNLEALMSSELKASMRRSAARRSGARLRPRLSTNSCCRSVIFSATKARTPPGRMARIVPIMMVTNIRTAARTVSIISSTDSPDHPEEERLPSVGNSYEIGIRQGHGS